MAGLSEGSPAILCRYRITANTPPLQGGDAGSTPATCSTRRSHRTHDVKLGEHGPLVVRCPNVEGTTTIETAAAAKKLIGMLGNQNVRAISVNRVNDKSDEVIVELDFVPGLAPHLHGFTLQVNGLTCGYAGTGPSNLYEVLQAAGVSEAQVAREDITQKSTKTIPLRLERAVTQYGDFQFA